MKIIHFGLISLEIKNDQFFKKLEIKKVIRLDQLEKYNNIMKRYHSGKFGNENLTMHEILEKAGEKDLFEKMSVSEIETLINISQGFTKKMFIDILNQKILSNERGLLWNEEL